MNDVKGLLTLIAKDCEYGAGKRARERAKEALSLMNGSEVIYISGNDLLHLKSFRYAWVMRLYCMVWLPLKSKLTRSTGGSSNG